MFLFRFSGHFPESPTRSVDNIKVQCMAAYMIGQMWLGWQLAVGTAKWAKYATDKSGKCFSQYVEN